MAAKRRLCLGIPAFGAVLAWVLDRRRREIAKRPVRCLLESTPDSMTSTTVVCDPAALALPHVAALRAYVPGEQPQDAGWTKLNTNENPYPPSPRVAEAVAAEVARLPLYPHPRAQRLREAIAQLHGVDATHVIIGNGSDDILNMLVRTFSGPSKVAGWTVPSYSLYVSLLEIKGDPLVGVPFDASFALPVEAIAQSGANLFLLTSPNAPSGTAFPLAELARLAARFPGILVLDEAYVDFGGESGLPLLAEFPNVVIVRTFSKSWGLAGLRVGYAVAHPSIIALLDKVRDSYNVDRLAQAAALAALGDQPHWQANLDRIRATRDAAYQRVQALGWHVYPSATNFLLLRPAHADGTTGLPVATSLFEHLLANRVLVRHFKTQPLVADYLRVSIGSPAAMERFFAVVDSWRQTSLA